MYNSETSFLINEIHLIFIFGRVFKNPSLKIAMSGRAGGREGARRASSVNLFSKLYVTFFFNGLLSYLVGIEVSHAREKTLTFFII